MKPSSGQPWWPVVLSLGVVCAGSLTATAVPATAATPTAARPASCSGQWPSFRQPDYNGDRRTDVVVGLPGADHDTGAIEVIERRHRPVVYQPGDDGIPAMPRGARFGAALTSTNLNDDACTDLLVGAPGLTVDGASGAGGVVTMLGGAHRLRTGSLITLNSPDAPGPAEAGAQFGAALSTDGYGAVAVGAPGASVTSPSQPDPQVLSGAGEVIDMSVTAGGSLWKSGVDTMPSPQAGAHYGAAVLDDVAVGAPDAHHNGKRDTGYVNVNGGSFYGPTAGAHLGATFAQDPAIGDDDYLGLVVGAPGETVHGRAGAGAAETFLWDPDGSGAIREKTITAAAAGVVGKPQQGAHFGATISSTFIGKGHSIVGTLAVGVPGEKVGGAHSAGAVDLATVTYDRYGQTVTGVRWSLLTMSTTGVPGAPHASDGFGSAVAAVRVNLPGAEPGELAVGVPGYGASRRPQAGAVEMIRLGPTGPAGTSNRLLRRIDGAHPDDAFGFALA